MKIRIKSYVVFSILNSVIGVPNMIPEQRLNSSCGLDKSPVDTVYEGVASIETYPWMGILTYPMGKSLYTTSVVLVTRQMVIAAAIDIDNLPKWDFRARARVVLGQRCGAGGDIRVRDYTYHPEYNQGGYSALVMVQLEIDNVKVELRPICQPPTHFVEPEFHVMTLSENCKKPGIQIYRMKYVNMKKCKNFYRRFGLSQASLWPRHSVCARAAAGSRCVWRSGAALVVKQDSRWRLLGFSVYGPGCSAPARFLDYGMYQQWVRRSAGTVGQPAITRLADNHIVMRKSLSKVQRFGPCDPEEKLMELYTDRIAIMYKPGDYSTVYNISIYSNVEYSCVVFYGQSLVQEQYEKYGVTPQPPDTYEGASEVRNRPRISLQRWCFTSQGLCHGSHGDKGFNTLRTDYFVTIKFTQSVEFRVLVYGRKEEIKKGISAPIATKYANVNRDKLYIPWKYGDVRYAFMGIVAENLYTWYDAYWYY